MFGPEKIGLGTTYGHGLRSLIKRLASNHLSVQVFLYKIFVP